MLHLAIIAAGLLVAEKWFYRIEIAIEFSLGFVKSVVLRNL